MTTFQLRSDDVKNAKLRKLFWLGLIRSHTDKRIDYYVSTLHFPESCKENPFKPFDITYSPIQKNGKLAPTEELVTRSYLPARFSDVDRKAVVNYGRTTWKFLTKVGTMNFEALQIWGNPQIDLVLPKVCLFTKKVYRDLELERPFGYDPSRKFTTPAQKYDIQVINLVSDDEDPDRDRSTGTVESKRMMTEAVTVHTTNKHFSETVPLPPPIIPPPVTIHQQMQSVANQGIMRHQRDFPAPGWSTKPEFRHIIKQLNPSDPTPYPNIYLRLTISTNHTYHVNIKDPNVIRKLPCISIIDGKRILHFAPILRVSQKYLALYKHFSKANTGQKGKWVPLPHLPDLAFLNLLIPMREHHEVIYAILKECK